MARHRGSVKFPREWPVRSSHRTTQIIAHELGHAFAVAALGGRVRIITFGRNNYDWSPDFGNFTHGGVGQQFYVPHATLQAAISLSGPLAEDAFAGQEGTQGWDGDQRNFRRYVANAALLPPARVVGLPRYRSLGSFDTGSFGPLSWLMDHAFFSKGWGVPAVNAAADAYAIASTLVPFMGPFVEKWGTYLAEHRTKYISYKQSTIIDQMYVDARLSIPSWVKLDIGGIVADLKHDYLTSHLRAAVIAAEEKQKHD